MTQFSFHLDGAITPATKGPYANKKLLQFSVSLLDEGRSVLTIRGLRVGAGRLFDVRTRNAKGLFFTVVEPGQEALAKLMRPVFAIWSREHPDVSFPVKEVDKKDKVDGIVINADGSVVRGLVRRFRPVREDVEADDDGIYRLEETKTGYRQWAKRDAKDKPHWFGTCPACGDFEMSAPEHQKDRTCPKCKRDFNEDDLVLGLDWDSKLIDKRKEQR